MAYARIRGLKEVRRMLNDEIKKRPKQTKAGLIAAGLYLQGEAQKLTPVDTGNLKSSAYTAWEGGQTAAVKGFSDRDGRAAAIKAAYERALTSAGVNVRRHRKGVIKVEVGFGAFYAVFVHEDKEAKHKVGQWKYLETAMKNNINRIADLVEEKVKK